MKLITRTPMAPTPFALRDIDRLFDRFFNLPAPPMPPLESMWVPALDYAENDKEFVVRLEVPGIPKENLDINLEGTLLTISGHREFVKETEQENYIVNERETGKFVRTLRLPVPVIEDKITALVDHGVLTVRLPKEVVAPKSRITIK